MILEWLEWLRKHCPVFEKLADGDDKNFQSLVQDLKTWEEYKEA